MLGRSGTIWDHASVAHEGTALLPLASRQAVPKPKLLSAVEGGTAADGHPCRTAQAVAFLDTSARRCYSRKGQVCNKTELGGTSEKDEELDERMRHLQADLQLRPKMFVKSDGVIKRIQKANEAMRAEHDSLEKSARAFEKSRSDFEAAFGKYKKHLAMWTGAVANLEDDYTLDCRAFHDVTMECEAKWRAAMRAWAAREPLPKCLVGVVTPFSSGTKPPSSWSYF